MIRVLTHKEDAEPLLERYAKVRRAAWVDFTNKGSIDFKLRLHGTDKETVARREGFMHALNNDPDIHLKMASMMNNAIEDMFEPDKAVTNGV